jgi:hypothetical protein
VQKVIESAPYEAQVETGAGAHTILVTAYAKDNATLADQKMTVEASGGSQTDYKAAMPAKINQANTINDQVTGYANRINGELDLGGSLSTGLMNELRDLLGRATAMSQSVRSMQAPSEYQDIQTQFVQLCDYIQVRSDALVRGSETYNSTGAYGNFKNEFNRGATAKASFFSAWPGFLSTCRARGISI